MKYLWLAIGLFILQEQSFAKRKVTFFAEDGVAVTADLYYSSRDYPYVLLFHQDGYSRGEYKDIAERILKLKYNCLAVDLRAGNEVNYVSNETARYARMNDYSNSLLDAKKDIKAAIDYAYRQSDTTVILFGSSFSASLCLKTAVHNPRVHAVIAFGPGEYFKKDFVLKEEVPKLQKPVFIATNEAEYAFVEDMFKTNPPENVTIFSPHNGKGEHGSKALWESSENSKEYWFALLMFFGKL